MKILYLALVELEIPSGPTVHTLNLMKGFKQINTHVRLLCPKPSKDIEDIKDFDCSFLPFFGYSTLRLFLFNVLSCFYVIKNFITYKPDILYLRDRPGNIFAIICAKIFRIPYFIEMNGVLDADFANNRKIHRYLRNKQFAWAKGLIFNCYQLLDQYFEAFYCIKNKTTVVTMHVDCDIFKTLSKNECRQKLNIQSDTFVIGYVGGFSPRHNIEILKELLLELEKQNIDAMLLLIGDTFDKARKEALLDGLQEDQIRITGWLSHEELSLYINTMDIGTALVKNIDGNGSLSFLKVKEYLACGVPVILNSGDVSALKEYPEGSIIAFADNDSENITVDMLIKSVIEIRKKLNSLKRNHISQFIADKYNLSKAAKQTSAFFRAYMDKQKD